MSAAPRPGRRVVVTGVGLVSPLGERLEDFSEALRAGRTAVAPLGETFEDLRAVPGAAVRGFDPEAHFGRAGASLDRVSQFAVLAARRAVADAAIAFDPGFAARTAVVLGSATGGQATVDDSYRRLYRDGGRVPPLTIPKWMVNAPAGQVTMAFGLTGLSFCVASACASATHALGIAADLVRRGVAEAALSGGADCSLTYGAVKCWEALRVMSPDVCRPFSFGRRGMVLGEGAAVFVLEPLEAAQRRGAPIHAEVLGFGASSDAASIAAPKLEGPAAAMAACLRDAGLDPADVDHINAHGTGTLANDKTETAAIRAVFGRRADQLTVSSTKALHGHVLGAAGAIEVAAVLSALKGGFAPPTANYDASDPECDLDYVPNAARPQAIATALSNSFAFGGHNAVLALGALR